LSADRLELRDLHLEAPVGVLDAERLAPQPIAIDLDVEVDFTAAVASDDLDDTVNYAGLVRLAATCATRAHHDLLESLAGEIAAEALGSDTRISAIEVRVTKLHPPVDEDLGTVAARRRLER
jgi:7,8-dihydroneopterin aldolase/epimerase/oxygenase